MSGVQNPMMAAYALAFEVSPIILNGGVASLMGGILPICVFTEALNLADGLLSGQNILDPSTAFAHFHPLAGSTLLSYEFGKYPFFNRGVAANAVIKQVRNVSLRMVCPARNDFGIAVKTATWLALTATLDYHNQIGGTYTVLTPSQIYVNCLLNRITDVSQGGTNQAQIEFQWDFEQPLLTEQQLQSVQCGVMQMLGSGGQITGAPSWSGLLSGLGSSVGIPTPGLLPAVSSVAGTGIAPVPGIGNVPQ